MPTATATSPRTPRRAKTARTAASRRAPTKTRARKATRSKRTKATRAKAARVATATAVGSGVPVARYRTTSSFGDYAERAVLIPVGAALTARDRVLSSVNDAISSYSSPTRAQAQLRRFERRGVTARKRLEREVRKARVRVERELRQRRREIEKTVSDLEDRRETVAKNGTELANRVQERIGSLV
jgi:hypothetical protein